MTELEYREYSEGVIQEYYEATLADCKGLFGDIQAQLYLKMYEEEENYLACAGVKRAIDEFDSEIA
tara:strand:- start:1500 stop:1697 length:198 start_codon:yes stop_codon:yes gene_type:complete